MDVKLLGELYHVELFKEATSKPDFKLSEMSLLFRQSVDALASHLDSIVNNYGANYTTEADQLVPPHIRNYLNSSVVDRLQATNFSICDAAQIGSLELLKYLIKYCHVNKYDYQSVYREACSGDHVDIMLFLANDVKLEDGFDTAVLNDSVGAVEWIINRMEWSENTANMEILHNITILAPTDGYSTTLTVFTLLGRGLLNVAKYVIRIGNYENITTSDDEVEWSVPILRFMKQWPRDYNEILFQACLRYKLPLIDVLMEDHKDLDWDKAFEIAATAGNVSVMAKLRPVVSYQTMQTSNINGMLLRRTAEWLEKNI